MIVVNQNKNINNSKEKYISDSKLSKKNNNIYSKIAPPNTFKKRNQNQILRGSKLFQNEKYQNSNKLINPYINNSNIIKNNSISKSHIILNDYKINTSFRNKTKLIGGNNIFINNNINNSHNYIITPKKLLFGKFKVKGNKIDSNKYKTEKQNISNNELKEDFEPKIIKLNNNNIKNIKKRLNYQNNFIKEKYDLLLKKTKDLLYKYQQIIDYYQEKENADKSKNE